MEDLPDLDDFFEKPKASKSSKKNKKLSECDNIDIYLSKEEDNWITTDFLNVAIGGIGLHLSLPIQLELTASELKNIKIKFLKKVNGKDEMLMTVPALIRWQENDNITGNLKLGIHFKEEFLDNEQLISIMKDLETLKACKIQHDIDNPDLNEENYDEEIEDMEDLE